MGELGNNPGDVSEINKKYVDGSEVTEETVVGVDRLDPEAVLSDLNSDASTIYMAKEDVAKSKESYHSRYVDAHTRSILKNNIDEWHQEEVDLLDSIRRKLGDIDKDDKALTQEEIMAKKALRGPIEDAQKEEK